MRKRSPKRDANRGLVFIASFVLLCAIIGAVARQVSKARPTWYAPPPAAAPEVVELADTVEYRIVEEVQKIRDTDVAAPWTMRLREYQVNAWLAARLPAWLEHEHRRSWPDNIDPPQIRVLDDTLEIAIGLRDPDDDPDDLPQVVGVALTWQITDDAIELGLDSIFAGRLHLPGGSIDTVAKLMSKLVDEDVLDAKTRAAIDDLLANEDGLSFSLPRVFDLADGRRIRVMDIQRGEDFLDCTLRTLGHDDDAHNNDTLQLPDVSSEDLSQDLLEDGGATSSAHQANTARP